MRIAIPIIILLLSINYFSDFNQGQSYSLVHTTQPGSIICIENDSLDINLHYNRFPYDTLCMVLLSSLPSTTAYVIPAETVSLIQKNITETGPYNGDRLGYLFLLHKAINNEAVPTLIKSKYDLSSVIKTMSFTLKDVNLSTVPETQSRSLLEYYRNLVGNLEQVDAPVRGCLAKLEKRYLYIVGSVGAHIIVVDPERPWDKYTCIYDGMYQGSKVLGYYKFGGTK